MKKPANKKHLEIKVLLSHQTRELLAEVSEETGRDWNELLNAAVSLHLESLKNKPVGELEKMFAVGDEALSMDKRTIFLCRKNRPPQYLTPRDAMLWIVRKIVREESDWSVCDSADRFFDALSA